MVKHSNHWPPGQDHKQILDGNKGPNTGGMGFYAPTTFVSPELMSEIEEKILKATFNGLHAEGSFPLIVLFAYCILLLVPIVCRDP